MFQKYFKSLYQKAMHEAYSFAHMQIFHSLQKGGKCLDCGAATGHKYNLLREMINLNRGSYYGVEWNEALVLKAQKNNLNIIKGNLNEKLQFPDNEFKCIFGLSVLEHLLNPCHYIKECYRTLDKDGTLILLTPNISTFFTAVLILFGKMPSSGPHPDSNQLVKHEQLVKVSHDSMPLDTESDTPIHRHLVIFSYRVLISYLRTLGFKDVEGYGFGLYPFPNFMQPLLQRIDPYHCHQMVMIAYK